MPWRLNDLRPRLMRTGCATRFQVRNGGTGGVIMALRGTAR